MCTSKTRCVAPDCARLCAVAVKPAAVSVAPYPMPINSQCKGANSGCFDRGIAQQHCGMVIACCDITCAAQGHDLSATTKYVTISIGGNDLDFRGVILKCLKWTNVLRFSAHSILALQPSQLVLCCGFCSGCIGKAPQGDVLNKPVSKPLQGC